MDERSVGVAPWGAPGTPVLPAWFIEALSDQALPWAITNSWPELRTFADLSRYWEVADEPLDRSRSQALVAAAQQVLGSGPLEAIPAWVSADQLAALPLSVRVSNAIRRGKLLPSTEPVTADQLLQLPNFGFTSLIELLCVLEAAGPLEAAQRDLDGDSLAASSRGPVPWAGAHTLAESLVPVLLTARDVLDCRTVADVLCSPRLVDLLTEVDMLETMRGLQLDALPTGAGPVSGLIDAVRRVEAEHGPENIGLFIRHKVEKSDTLVQLGEERGVTRERIRQLEAKVAKSLDAYGGQHAAVIASLVRSELPPIVDSALVDQQIEAMLLPAVEAAGDDLSELASVLPQYLVRSRLALSSTGSLVLNDEGRKLLDELSRLVVAEADDVGLVDLQAIVAREAPSGLPIFDQLVALLGLKRIGERVALRDTLRARAKLALLDIGRPATKEEIAAAGGLALGTLSSTLSNIESIARADKDHWGLTAWIDDVYEGIPAEIQQRIDQHGGAVPLSFLLQDIPERFRVTEASVRSYVATRQFSVVDGMVSIADESSVAYRPVEDVATRNADGDLCWDFKVEARYFDGFSITGFPPELARELGCGPNDRRDVPVTVPAGCGMASVIWRLTSVNGAAEIGRARDALAQIGVAAGERARLVISRHGSVRFERIKSVDLPLGSSAAGDLLARLKSRRRIS
ncbi:MAG: hypothetical protein OXP28_11920 [Gammaproteobacteria bacterium]|nr:hypothetical protein [Gammaproteobacteria bacterium]